MLYNNLSGYFRSRYNSPLKKICIDGGFTCPNRDGKCGVGGCIFCGERGAGEHISNNKSIPEQVNTFFEKKPKGSGFIAYFQNFTNTYAPVSTLKERYDSALTDKRIVALAIGTRPDCISDEIAELIASYKSEYEVWVELGLQTSNDKTAEIINRGYTSEVFTQAVDVLNRYKIPVVVHLIVGLPSESVEDVKNTIRFINRHKIWGLKIHSIYVMQGTVLEKMYNEGKYTPPTFEEYVDSVVYILTHISPDIIIHRLTGDCPKDLLVAPQWNTQKNEIINAINKKMAELHVAQGSFY